MFVYVLSDKIDIASCLLPSSGSLIVHPSLCILILCSYPDFSMLYGFASRCITIASILRVMHLVSSQIAKCGAVRSLVASYMHLLSEISGSMRSVPGTVYNSSEANNAALSASGQWKAGTLGHYRTARYQILIK